MGVYIYRVLSRPALSARRIYMHIVAVCCSVLQCVAVGCSGVQCIYIHDFCEDLLCRLAAVLQAASSSDPVCVCVLCV